MNSKSLKVEIEGYDFPPSKNKLYYGKALKWQWIKRFRETNKNFVQKVKHLVQKYKEVRLVIIFALTDEFYAKFEPQNYTEIIFDAIFDIYKDNVIAEYLVKKVRSSENKIIITIFPQLNIGSENR